MFIEKLYIYKCFKRFLISFLFLFSFVKLFSFSVGRYIVNLIVKLILLNKSN